jgi:hypothetical protein
MSQAVGLGKHVNPIQRRRTERTMILQKQAVVILQDEVQDEDELDLKCPGVPGISRHQRIHYAA